MTRSPLVLVCVAALGIVHLAAGAAPPEDGRSDKQPADRAARDTVLRVARSHDGLEFADSGEVFVARAAAPDLVRLPNGDLLALFDYAAGRSREDDTVMAISRSRDEGRSWSPVQAIRFTGPGAQHVRGRFGDLVQMHSDHMQLFFVSSQEKQAEKATTQPKGWAARDTIIRAAVSRDGLKYRLVPSPTLRLRGDTAMHPTVMTVAGALHLYAAGLGEKRSEGKQAGGLAYHAVSRDGRRFVRLVPAQTPGVQFVGSILRAEDGLRAFVTAEQGIRSLFSSDGRKWQAESGLRLVDAWDPAVVRLEDGSFLMLYCAPLESQSPSGKRGRFVNQHRADSFGPRGGTDRPACGSGGDVLVAPDDQVPPADEFDYDRWAEEMGEPALVPLPDEEELALLSGAPPPGATLESTTAERSATESSREGSPAGMTAEADGVAVDEIEGQGIAGRAPSSADDVRYEHSEETDPHPADDWADGGSTDRWPGDETVGATAASDDRDDKRWARDSDSELAEGWAEDDTVAAKMEFAPLPLEGKHVDYLQWFQENMAHHVEDNAFDVYAEFIPGWDRSSTQPEWPDLVNMFCDPDYDGPPGPWHPATRREWEASDRASQELLDKFREAAHVENYATRLAFPEDPMFIMPDGNPLLVEMLLPSLARHRDLVKATLADAWRLEEGEVSQGRMLEAMETTLRAASHMASGVTLIENLVGIAERNLVQRNARWALAHDVLDERGLEESLNILIEHDHDDVDPKSYIRGEHAVEMQMAQYLFDGSDPDGPNQEAAALVSHFLDGGEANEERLKRIGEMTMDDAREAVRSFDGYCSKLTEQMRAGYPAVRAADLDATADRYVRTNALTEILMPSLSRVHQLRTRGEASRRATQLCYATHLFKARHGRWPESLNELPEEYGPHICIDPFTGREFGYRLTDGGPRIYSLSENGADDGGIHSPRWDDEIMNDAGSDDYVFWPPQEGR